MKLNPSLKVTYNRKLDILKIDGQEYSGDYFRVGAIETPKDQC